MPYEITIKKHGLYLKFSGIYDKITREEALKHIIDNPLFKQIEYVISDFLDVTEIKFNDIEISTFSLHFKLLSYQVEKMKIAYVLKEKHKRVMQKLILYSSFEKVGWNFSIFNNIEDAKNWVK